MSQPTVCAVMLVNGRPEMVKRAIASFRAQTYQDGTKLIIFDTTPKESRWDFEAEPNEVHVWHWHPQANKACDETIGALRNKANDMCLDADLIAHFDSDDISHPRRLEEQVALMEATGKQCVGYRELLFWDTRWCTCDCPAGRDTNGKIHSVACMTVIGPEAWIYRNRQANWAAGASFMYRRELWERQPFDDAPHEDQRWWRTPLVSRNCLGVSAVDPTKLEEFQIGGVDRDATGDMDPRMICGIHGDNSEAYDRGQMMRNPDVWRRAPGFDSYCERTMRL